MPLPTERQLEIVQALRDLRAATQEHFPQSSYLPPSLQSVANEAEALLVDAAAPLSIEDVRTLPVCLWVEGVSHVLYTVEEGEDDEGEDDEDPNAFCVDWWAFELDKLPNAVVGRMVRAGRVQTPQQLMKWIERKAKRSA